MFKQKKQKLNSKEINIEENKRIESYLKTRKRIQRLLFKKIDNYEQKKAIAEYIRRLYTKQREIEEKLKYLGVIKEIDDLSQWTTREIQSLKKKQDLFYA